jgi:hypothetical protein
MNVTQTIEPIRFQIFLVDLALAAILSWLLGWMYSRYGSALSNRRQFARNFVMLTMTTMLIITIVKSSLTLALGLVGAMSIVRFRSAIKEPEELTYLFLCTALGFGLGAGQREVTLIGFSVISGLCWLNSRGRGKDEHQTIHLTITSERPARTGLEQILGILNKYCNEVNLNRFDESSNLLEASLLVEFDDFQKFNQCKAELRGLDDSVTVNLLESRVV